MHFQTHKSAAATLAFNTLSSILAPPISTKGCGKPLPDGLTPGGPSVNFTLHSKDGGGERKYLLHLPEAFSAANNKPAPLIIALHAFTQTTSSMEEITRFSESDTNREYVVVYPEGINNVWLGDPGAPNSSTIDDRPFISDLLDALESRLCLDKSRFYTTGFSNGGGLSGLLACYPPTSQRIAAFSGVSAAYYTEDSLGEELFERGACQVGGGKAGVEGEGERGRAAGSESRKPFLDIHGDSDMVIAYDGDNSRFDVDQNGIPDPDTLPIPLWLGDWARRNGYPDSEIATMPHFLETGDIANSTVWLHNGTVERSSWTCAGWSDVVVGMKVRGLGHGWPSTVPLEGVYEEMRLGTSGWNASAVLMEWFGGWSLRLGNSL